MSTVTSSSPTPAPAHPPSQVIVLAAAAGVSRATRALFDVVRGLDTAGISTEVVLLRHGARLEELRALCPVKVVDDLTRSPVDRLLRLVRLGLVGGAIKGRVVRRWLRASRRPNTVGVVCGLAAARLVRTTLHEVVHWVREMAGASDQALVGGLINGHYEEAGHYFERLAYGAPNVCTDGELLDARMTTVSP